MFFQLATQTYLHEQTCLFGEIDYVYANEAFYLIVHAEHEPVELIWPVCIVTDKNVEKSSVPLADLVNVGTFEISVESHCFWGLVNDSSLVLRLRLPFLHVILLC